MNSARAAGGPSLSLGRDLLSSLLAGGLAACLLVALLLLARRLAGGLVNPLDGISLVGVTGFGLMLVGLWRLGWQTLGSRGSSFVLVVPVLPGLVMFLLLAVLSLPGTANWALMLSWLAFFSCEAAWWWSAYSANQERASRRVTAPQSTAELAAQVAVEVPIESLASDVFQQITRSRDGARERISVMLRLPLAVGQRIAVAHVPLCPPLSDVPEFEAEVTDGPDASVILTNIHTYGLRLEVRLEEPAEEECAVGVEVEGRGMP